MTDSHAILGFDIGGSYIKTGLVDPVAGRLISELRTIPAPDTGGPEPIIEAIDNVTVQHANVTTIGVGFPGVIRNGRIEAAPHLSRAWVGRHPERLLHERLGLKITVLNDADAAGIAEMRFGAGCDRNRIGGGTVLMVTLGTGIGTALFHDGHLFPNTEFGHIELDGADAEDTAAASVKTRLNLDWDEWGERVNRYLNQLDKLLSPTRIILGGAISEHYDSFRHQLRVNAELTPASFRNAAGVIGAACAAFGPVEEP